MNTSKRLLATLHREEINQAFEYIRAHHPESSETTDDIESNYVMGLMSGKFDQRGVFERSQSSDW